MTEISKVDSLTTVTSPEERKPVKSEEEKEVFTTKVESQAGLDTISITTQRDEDPAPPKDAPKKSMSSGRATLAWYERAAETLEKVVFWWKNL